MGVVRPSTRDNDKESMGDETGRTRDSIVFWIAGLTILWTTSVTMAVTIGSVSIPPLTVWKIALSALFGWARDGWPESRSTLSFSSGSRGCCFPPLWDRG